VISRIPRKFVDHAAYSAAPTATTARIATPTGLSIAMNEAKADTIDPSTHQIKLNTQAIIENPESIGPSTIPTAPIANARPHRTHATSPIVVIVS
jgi:hypothetical protein